MKLISEAPKTVSCLYSQENNYTVHKWKTFLCTPSESKEMRSAIEGFLDFVKENKITKHVIDVKDCTDGFTDDDLKFITDYLVPKEIEYGVKYVANIVSDDVFTQVTTEFWQEKTENGFLIKNCSTMEQATEWLKDK